MASAYLAKYGASVLDNGYSICFIRPGEKRPFGKEWEEKVHGPKLLAKFIERGNGHFGVGIKTKRTPLVDIDCYDEKIVRQMRRFVEERIGPGLERVGLPPKLGMLYRARKPFTKVQSKTFIDDEGRSVKLEVLGDGQQFVAFHIHPDTGEPYRWKDKRHPGNTPADELQEITEEDAVEFAAEFERLARKRGWSEKLTKSQALAKQNSDDPFITDKQIVEMPAEELRARLQMVPNAEEYETWFFVGMALYHQFGGSDEGLAMWQEWSATAHNYDEEACDEKWPTFEIEGKKREPLTARYILKLAKEEEERLAGEELDDIKEAISEATDLAAFKRVTSRIKGIAFDTILRESLIKPLQEQFKKITGNGMSVTAMRSTIRYENPEFQNTPPWLAHFVYVQKDETFYSTKTRQSLSVRAFDATYGRYMMTKKDRLEGRSSPEHTASHVALYRYEIPTVENRMYLPGFEELFEHAGLQYVNSYSKDSLPATPERLNKRQRRLVRRIEEHLEHLFANDRDRKLLLSWMAYIVQTGGRVNWAPVIQGGESDGKSFFHMLMGSALGIGNVRTIGGDALAEKFTPWAEGVQFCFVEEVRLHGKDRFAIINKLKPYVTNVMAEIRRMGVDRYDVLNTVNYMLTTNFKDGVPASRNDTRYFPLFSRWQLKEEIDRFNAENPDYYTLLHEVLEDPGAIRRFFLDYELHAEFNPKRRAPVSAAKAEMIYLNQSEEEEIFEAIMAESTSPLVSKTLLDSAELGNAFGDAGLTAPQGQAMKRMLTEHGFATIGQHWIDGKSRRLWSQRPSLFTVDEKISVEKIKEWIADEADPI